MQEVLIPEQSLANFCAFLCEHTGGHYGLTPQGAMAYKTPASVWYSRTILSSLDRGTIIEALDDIRRSAGAPPSLASFTCETVDEDTPALMAEAGFTLRSTQIGMVYPTKNRKKQNRPGSEVVEIMRASEIVEWNAVVAESFPKADETEALRAVVDSNECIFYTVRADGRPVGTLLLHLDPSNAGIHEVAVLPAYRGKGLSRAIVEVSLDDAAARDIPLVSLQASELGFHVYLNAGFTRVSTLQTWQYEKTS